MIAAATTFLRQTFTLDRPGGSGDPFGEIALRLFGGGRLTVGEDDYDLESDWLVRLGPLGPRRGDRRALAQAALWRRRVELVFDAETMGTAGDLHSRP